jgi:aspartyl-tRNA(Asn)/glutamyl-tRNA(Gln) amidotransferase subunit A
MNPGGSSAGAAPPRRAATGPCTWAPTSAAPSACPPPGAAWWGFKPSLGRVPIDPPYYGRVAGPMTRTVEDAALMMRALARPDARDVMSLPPADIPGSTSPSTAGLRLGLLLDAGIGMPVDPEVRAAVRGRGAPPRGAGAAVEPMAPSSRDPCSTASTSSGASAPGRRSARSRGAAGAGAALHPGLGGGRARPHGAPVYEGFSQMLAMRFAAAGRASPSTSSSRRWPRGRLPGGAGLAPRRPAAPLRAHRLHGGLQHVGTAGGVGERGLDGGGVPIGLQIAGAASTTSGCCASRGASRREGGGEAVAAGVG